MGGFVTKLLNVFSLGLKKRILMIGMDAAGKTTILYQLKLGEHVQCAPTIGFNMETVQYKNIQFTIWDIYGQHGFKTFWSHYLTGTDALIFVIDSADIDRHVEAKDSLQHLLSRDEIKDVPLLVMANKQDIALLSPEEITDMLELKYMKGNRSWFVQGCSALQGVGFNEGLDWLSIELKKKK